MKTLLIFLLLTSVCYAGDYVCFDKDGYITSKHFSVDGVDLDKRVDCLKVSRSVFETVHRYSKVDGGSITDMTQGEIDTINAPSVAATNTRKVLVQSVKDKLKLQGFTDEEITVILSTP